MPWDSERIEVVEVITRSRYGRSSIIMAGIGKLESPLSLLNIAQVLNADCDYVLCLDRWLTLPCKILSVKLGVPLITYVDSPKYLHLERLVTIRERMLRPMALAWYITIGFLSDVAICVSKYIEDYLSMWGVRAMTIEPSYALLHEDNDIINNNDDSKVDELENGALLCSCPFEITTLIALRNPDVPVVVTGPQALYFREYLKIKSLTNKLKNIFLARNISDRALEKLHDKIAASLIARPALAGLSMTLIQELYFGKAILTDKNTASRIRGLVESKAVLINDEYIKWPELAKGLVKEKGYDANELEAKAKLFFDEMLSPMVFARSFEYVLTQYNPSK
jgi:hypothetical protein